MQSTPDGSAPEPRRGGIVDAARRAVAHARSLADLQRELARTELQRKGGTLGAGGALGVAAAILALFALGFGLAALAAILALVVDWWLALLIVSVALFLLVVVLVLIARELIRASTPLKPEQSIEEARLTREALRGVRDG